MIDIHCHILPGLDDGPESLDEAMEMCLRAAAEGVRTIVATPHFKPGTYECAGADILAAVAALNEAIEKEGLELRICTGAEVAVSPEMQACLKPGGYLTINNGRYFLAEFPPLSVPSHWDAFLLSFLDAGMRPIIVHPERNTWFINHREALAAAVQSGIMVQITATSVTGGFGPEARDFSAYLLSHNLVHAIASDGHSADLRPALLAEAAGIAADLIGKERATALTTSIPQAIIENRPIPAWEPVTAIAPARVSDRPWFQRVIRPYFARI
ncbi:MAG: CpsB/CapC family capsule biosynthesis tyrosine phosphatase [Smithellaceae bacterium]|nr:CpsB/CapC family capsule biosynthesis tyrosine phosphatase [Smithellaceae bacterium]